MNRTSTNKYQNPSKIKLRKNLPETTKKNYSNKIKLIKEKELNSIEDLPKN